MQSHTEISSLGDVTSVSILYLSILVLKSHYYNVTSVDTSGTLTKQQQQQKPKQPGQTQRRQKACSHVSTYALGIEREMERFAEPSHWLERKLFMPAHQHRHPWSLHRRTCSLSHQIWRMISRRSGTSLYWITSSSSDSIWQDTIAWRKQSHSIPITTEQIYN